MNFALITEGASEHRIVKHIVVKYFKDHDPDINQIQPKVIDEKQDDQTKGGWNEVLKYCERELELNNIFVDNDYLIIQIDTDQSQTNPFNVSHRHPENRDKTVNELYTDVVGKLNGLLPQSIIEKYADKIFFAICIHTIECWLLPLFYNNADRTKTINCLDALNRKLMKKDFHLITKANKNQLHGRTAYEEILKPWKKKKDIQETAKYNYGFKKFVEYLESIDLE
ncbi:MAG: hypothetical protein NTU44_00225 [Bacteroidetes bacterium]|nr:hypothetical protein [Bacteroidota bacterium]